MKKKIALSLLVLLFLAGYGRAENPSMLGIYYGNSWPITADKEESSTEYQMSFNFGLYIEKKLGEKFSLLIDLNYQNGIEKDYIDPSPSAKQKEPEDRFFGMYAISANLVVYLFRIDFFGIFAQTGLGFRIDPQTLFLKGGLGFLIPLQKEKINFKVQGFIDYKLTGDSGDFDKYLSVYGGFKAGLEFNLDDIK